MQIRRSRFSKTPRRTWLKAVGAALALVVCLVAGGAQAADTGERHHARGQYDSATATYTVVKGDDLIEIGERFGIPVDALKVQNKLTSDKIEIGQTLVVRAERVEQVHRQSA